MDPENLRYTKEHEWVRVEGDIGTIGITFHAQKELGDIVYVDLPKAGTPYAAGQDHRLGGIRQSRQRSSTRRFRAKWWKSTRSLAESPEMLNKDPYGAGWLVKIKLSEPGEAGKLLTAAEYQAYVGTESS